jgi:hypothetical protein
MVDIKEKERVREVDKWAKIHASIKKQEHLKQVAKSVGKVNKAKML